MTILDQFGKPASKGRLQRQIGEPGLTNVRSVWHQSQATGLTPERLAIILRAAGTGNEPLDYLTLAEEMEEREPHYRSVIGTRKLAVAKLPAVVQAVSDSEEDVRLADEITLLTQSPRFGRLKFNCMDAIGKGYSMHEIIWNRDGKIRVGGSVEDRWVPDYIWRDPRFFRFDRFKGEQVRLWTNEEPGEGEELERYKWICHRPELKSGLAIRGGMARIAATAFMCKGYALKDWLAFVEVFGVPIRLGRYSNSATEKDIDTLKTAVANLASDAGAVIPDSMMIEFMEVKQASQGSKEPIFERLGNWLDKQVSKAVLGQTMTTDDGSSMSQASVHNDVRLNILDYDATQLSNTLNEDLVRPYIDLNHGPRNDNEYPVIRIARDEPEDLKMLAESLGPFIKLGLRVEASVIRDKFGLPEPEEGAEILTAPEPTPAAGTAPEDPEDPEDPEGEPEPENDDPESNRTTTATDNGAVWGW